MYWPRDCLGAVNSGLKTPSDRHLPTRLIHEFEVEKRLAARKHVRLPPPEMRKRAETASLTSRLTHAQIFGDMFCDIR